MRINWSNSLHKISEYELDDLRKTNPEFRRLSYGRIQAWLIRASNHPVRYSVDLFFLSVSINVLLFSLNYQVNSVSWFLQSFVPKIGSFHPTLLNIQATLAALTYPIVIGFVSILLQGRQSATARVQIYLVDSGALPAGLSSLFLVLTMALQSGFEPLVETEIVAFWTCVDLLWAMGNVSGTIWFLYRTVQFLRPERQLDVIKRYGVTISWPIQLGLLLKRRFFFAAQHYGYLPKKTDDKGTTQAPELLVSPVWKDRGQVEVPLLLKHPRILADVRLRLLRWIVERWIGRNRTVPIQPKVLGLRTEGPKLILPLLPGEEYEGEVALCRRDGGMPLLPWEQRVLRCCFIFRTEKERSNAVPLDRIFEDLQGDVLQFLDRKQLKGYEDTIRFLEEIHMTLVRSSSFRDPSGKLDNYANLEDTVTFLPRRVYQNWLYLYRDVFLRTAFLIHEEEQYFIIATYIPTHLFRQARDFGTDTILKEIIHLPGALFYHLGLWWIRRIEEEGTVKHDASNGARLRPPYFGVYESALRHFVGAWETFAWNFKVEQSDKPLTWAQLKPMGTWFEAHLNRTLIMFVSSVAKGDSSAAEWMADVLQKWLGHLRLAAAPNGRILRYQRFVTLEIFSKEWEEVQRHLELEPLEHERLNAPSEVFTAALRNYWVDSCCVALYLLVMLGKRRETGDMLALRIARGMLEGHVLKGGGGAYEEVRPLRSFNDLLSALLRQYFAAGGYRMGYRARLDSLTESLQAAREPEMVPGRVYGGWGGKDLDSVKDGQIILLSCMATSDFIPSHGFTDSLRHLARDDDTARDMIDYCHSIISRLPQVEFSEWGEAISNIRGSRVDEATFNEAKEVVRKALE